MSQDKAHPTPSDYCRMDDGRCGICGGDWSVCGCQGMLDRRSLAAPVASNTTAEPAPIQPAGVEVERDAARYRWLRENKAYVAIQPHYKELPKSQRTGWTIRLVCGDDSSFDAAIDKALAAASQGDRGKT